MTDDTATFAEAERRWRECGWDTRVYRSTIPVSRAKFDKVKTRLEYAHTHTHTHEHTQHQHTNTHPPTHPHTYMQVTDDTATFAEAERRWRECGWDTRVYRSAVPVSRAKFDKVKTRLEYFMKCGEEEHGYEYAFPLKQSADHEGQVYFVCARAVFWVLFARGCVFSGHAPCDFWGRRDSLRIRVGKCATLSAPWLYHRLLRSTRMAARESPYSLFLSLCVCRSTLHYSRRAIVDASHTD